MRPLRAVFQVAVSLLALAACGEEGEAVPPQTPQNANAAPQTAADICSDRCDSAGHNCAQECTNDLLATHQPPTDAYYACHDACSAREEACGHNCEAEAKRAKAMERAQANPAAQMNESNQGPVSNPSDDATAIANAAPAMGSEGAGGAAASAGGVASGGGSSTSGTPASAPATTPVPNNGCNARYHPCGYGCCLNDSGCGPTEHVCPANAHSARVCCPNH